MSSTPPEANTEYSRGGGLSRDAFAGPTGAAGAARFAVGACGLLGVAVLVAAELTPLAHVRVAATSAPLKTLSTGAHHGYALVPIAAAAAALTVAALRHRWRAPPVALGALGLATLGIALLRDLPDAHTTGLVGSSSTHYALAISSPAVGLYLEALGGVLLLLGSGLGLLVAGPRSDRSRRLWWFGC